MAAPLDGVTVVLDPGHGDRAYGSVPADPGASAKLPNGDALECVFTWDTSMRLRRQLQELGAEVVLTLRAPASSKEPKDWSPDSFPSMDDYEFKVLVENPKPESVHSALMSRVETANRVYNNTRGPIYFLSLHFDSTSPRLAGVSFYYPAWSKESSTFVELLESKLRKDGRERRDLITGEEVKISSPGRYAVLDHSINPNSYLIELGNIRSLDESGGNPDLWRMRDLRVREEYAELLCETILEHHQTSTPKVRSRGRNWRNPKFLLVLAGFLGFLALAWRIAKVPEPSSSQSQTLEI